MSTLCTSSRRTNEVHASTNDAINIEDFIRLYYGEVGVDEFIELYNGRQDLKRVASRLVSAADVGNQTRSSSFDAVPALASQARNRALMYQDDDVSPLAVAGFRIILTNLKYQSAFFSRDFSTTSSPRRRSLDSDLREQLSQLAVDFRLNVPPRSQRLSKPLPATPPPISNRQPRNFHADTTSSSISPAAGVVPSHETPPGLNHVTGQKLTSDGSLHDELAAAQAGIEAAGEASLPLNNTTNPERDLIVSPPPGEKDCNSGKH